MQQQSPFKCRTNVNDKYRNRCLLFKHNEKATSQLLSKEGKFPISCSWVHRMPHKLQICAKCWSPTHTIHNTLGDKKSHSYLLSRIQGQGNRYFIFTNLAEERCQVFPYPKPKELACGQHKSNICA